MKNSQAVFIGLVLFLSLTTIFTIGCQKKQKDSEKVGALLPLTGNAAYIGESIRNGLLLAKEKSQSNIELVIEDTKGEPKEGVAIYRKLKAQYGVKYYIPVLSSITNAVLPLSSQKDEVLFATCVSTAEITKKSENLFRLFVNANSDARFMANYAIDTLNMKTFFILQVNDDFGNDYAMTFRDEITKKGGKVISIETFERSQNTFREILMLVKKNEKDVDAVYLLGYDNNMGVLLKQYSEIGLKKPILTIATVALDAVRKTIENNKIIPPIYYTNTTLLQLNDGNIEKQEFFSLYKLKYNQSPNYYSAFGYDLMNILLKSIKNSDDVKKFMLENQFNGVMGKINFDQFRDAKFNMIVEKLK